MRISHLALLALLAAGIAIAAFVHFSSNSKPPSPATRKLPYSLAKDTTIITAPLRPDGSPDYPAALNEMHGRNVTPDNNVFVPYLQIEGTEGHWLSRDFHDPTLKMLGMNPTYTDAQIWESYVDFIKPTLGADPDAYYDLHHAPWKPEQLPLAADFLKKEGPLLDLAVEGSKRPHWWIPIVVPAEAPYLRYSSLPPIGAIIQIATALQTRAMLRAGTGDFDGFLSDAAAVRRLGIRMTEGATWDEFLGGLGMNTLANQTVAALLATGTLNDTQCVKIRAMMAERGSLPRLKGPLEIYERFMVLDTVQHVATGITGPSFIDIDGMIAVHKASPDWDIVLRRMNVHIDSIAAIVNAEPASVMRDKHTAMQNDLKQWGAADIHDGNIAAAALAVRPGESRAVYSNRVATLLLVILSPDFLIDTELFRRRNLLSDDMVEVLIFAAQYKAKNGQWPASLDVLTAAGPKSIPNDLFGGGTVKYILTPKGPRIYSVGDNGRDDGGYRHASDSTRSDDIGIGADLVEPAPVP